MATETYRYTAVGLSSCREVAMPSTLVPTDLADATDANLDAALTRLYGLHREFDGEQRDQCHAEIMAVLGEQARRRDEWLNARRASAAGVNLPG